MSTDTFDWTCPRCRRLFSIAVGSKPIYCSDCKRDLKGSRTATSKLRTRTKESDVLEFFVQMRMASGAEVTCTHIQLTNVVFMNRLANVVKRAKLMGIPVTSPVATLGASQWLTTITLVNMIAEHLINSLRDTKQDALLRECRRVQRDLRSSSRYFSVEDIIGIELPIPSRWTATLKRKNADGTRALTHWVHSGDAFVQVRSPAGESVLIWDKLEQYSVCDARDE